jgi:multidrug efflux pump subunit AcrA (membrane-fusion protein)
MNVLNLRFVTAAFLLGPIGTGAGMWAFKALAATNPRGEQAATTGHTAPRLTCLIKVASRRDGVVLVIATEVAKGEKPAPDQVTKIKGQTYRRLKRGDPVEEGQLLALIDDPIAATDVPIKEAKVAAARADTLASEKARDEAKKRYDDIERRRSGRGLSSLEDVRVAELTWEKYLYEAKSKADAVRVAEAELRQAQAILQMTEVRSPCRGIIHTIFLHRGEGVHALEPVFAIQVPEGSD